MLHAKVIMKGSSICGRHHADSIMSDNKNTKILTGILSVASQ